MQCHVPVLLVELHGQHISRSQEHVAEYVDNSTMPVNKNSVLFCGVKIVPQQSDFFILGGIRSSLCLMKKYEMFFLIFRLSGAPQWQFGFAQVARALDFLCIRKGILMEIQSNYNGNTRGAPPEQNKNVIWELQRDEKWSKTLQISSLGKVKT